MLKFAADFISKFFQRMSNKKNKPPIKVIEFLNLHRQAFYDAVPYADETEHPNPSDSKSWSQILVSLLTDTKGLARKKGADLADGSDVKAANTWGAIDTPRFNGVIKAGTKSEKSGNMTYLDEVPFLYLVLWDNEPDEKRERCRIWVVRPQFDTVFRNICEKWYDKRIEKEKLGKKMDNFQLHPPRGKNSNIITNTCGNLEYPLLLSAVWKETTYQTEVYQPNILKNGTCVEV